VSRRKVWKPEDGELLVFWPAVSWKSPEVKKQVITISGTRRRSVLGLKKFSNIYGKYVCENEVRTTNKRFILIKSIN
jgi:hypothetical protein